MLLALCVLLVSASGAGAQGGTTGGTITGSVVDESGLPLRDADVFAPPSTARARTDSSGHFRLTGLDADFYHVRARHIGFIAMEITTDLGKNGQVDLKFEMKRRPVILDSVIVQADGKCPMYHYAGFNCRRAAGKGGIYMTDDDIMDRGAIDLGDLFRDVEGFRIEPVLTRLGMMPNPIPTRGNHCLNALVNGRPFAMTNPLPRYATDLIAVEIYGTPSEVPPEYQQYVSNPTIRQSAPRIPRDSPMNRCALAVYWTRFD
ncbi:MAG: carboxypeptidase-like regulatory domain-containing protein [Gemmatimonadaceae bacterium]